MLDINLVNGVTDPEVVQLITDYVNVRNDLPKCNCGNAARPCNGLKACTPTAAPATEGGNYTKLDRTMSIVNSENQTISQQELDEMLSELGDLSDSINTKFAELNDYIETNPSDPDIQLVIDDRDILEQFLNELSSMLEN